MDTIKFDSVNPFFNSKYASLTNILQAIKEPLSESGLVLIQMPCGDNGLTTLLVHTESGEYVSSTYHMQPDKNTPQAHGSVVSYQRRYCVQSILNLSFDEDDDANLATHGSSKPSDKPVTQKPSADDKPWMNEGSEMFNRAIAKLKTGETTIPKIKLAFRLSKKVEALLLEKSNS